MWKSTRNGLKSVWDVTGNGTAFDKAVWVDPKIWDMDQPQFTCSAPCIAKIPPWKGATRTVNYPVLTVSEGTWTSKVTIAPLTITEVHFEMVTLAPNRGNGRNQKRQAFGEFWPKPITTPSWPRVTYEGPDGDVTVTAPTVAFPTPPSSIGPNAPAPKQGNWPRVAIKAIEGIGEMPIVGQCSWPDFGCPVDPWQYGGMDGPPMDEPGDWDENEEDR
jgi:hypothetical protein